ncbi:MAG: AMIN domain-containing protein [Candidatus Aminicenantes bacterium]|nr:AMIN domain-containing protein [Candidatus Aminicenantes bacterium]
MSHPILLKTAALAGVVFLGFGAAAAEAGNGARILSVQHTVQAGALEVFIRVEGRFDFRFFELQGPKRLVIDLSPVEGVEVPEETEIGTYGVLRVRTGRPQTGTARVVIDLEDPAPIHLINRKPDGILAVFLPGKTAVSLPSPAETEPRPAERRATLLGLSLVNKSLSDDRFQVVFGRRTGTVPGVELSQDILRLGSWGLAAAAEYHRLSLEGQSTLTAVATSVTVSPLELALRVFYGQGAFRPYVSGGIVLCAYDELSPLRNTTGRATGFGLQGGLYWGPAFSRGLKARLYVKWTKATAVENGLEVSLGGTEVGAGLALALNIL